MVLPSTRVVDSDGPDWDALYDSFGAVLIGGLVALFLSGVAFLQVVLYWQTYPFDPKKTKAVVVVVWILDIVHSAMICTANWQNLVKNFGKWDGLDYITWSIAFTVALTATTTFLVHCFFSHRIHTLSRGNWWITVPLVTLALVRLVAATVSTTEMILLESFEQFVKKYAYVFTLGLSTSTALDIIITGILCYYLRQRKSGYDRMDRIINTLTLYTVETGMLTCVTTAVALICWVRMSDNLVFLGLHLAISKLYANSLLARCACMSLWTSRRGLTGPVGCSLNARRSLSNRSEGSSSEGYPMPVMFAGLYSPRSPITPWSPRTRSEPGSAKPLQVNIDIEQTIHREAFRQSQEAVGEACGPSPGSETDVKMV
ncbi:hypothetical protein L226DRAFT_513983 [Lentinus tigrinus ALCF2SS1-7]|uniref:uncharacterized protein n=1 Tax=Lentinus tigrinus ALCF2SS1-7 TaxID=1328758 RepID=UPI0011663869|nr:hypothetical protein L226DRAFT_513983 [Lentinus tigrinus ALCF2SS1-7]